MTRLDRIVIAFLLCAACAATPLSGAWAHASTRGAVAVVRCPAGVRHISLREDARYRVDGLAGSVILEVHHGTLRVVSSSCRDKVCIRAGSIDAPGEAVVCIPNGVTVTVEGDERSLDALVR
ncbi:MAG: NusG domain II-containing protein [Coriobacteriia bacterium]|nr:NusG domain II-containing protein [Coriobacteriia bacterium]